jgi:hypothetical protein
MDAEDIEKFPKPNELREPLQSSSSHDHKSIFDYDNNNANDCDCDCDDDLAIARRREYFERISEIVLDDDCQNLSEQQIVYHIKRLAELCVQDFKEGRVNRKHGRGALRVVQERPLSYLSTTRTSSTNNNNNSSSEEEEEEEEEDDCGEKTTVKRLQNLGHDNSTTSKNTSNNNNNNNNNNDYNQLNGIQTNEEADIVITVFQTIAERESALLRETCADNLGLLSRAFLTVDSMYEEKLLEIAFVLLEDDDPDVVKKTEDQFSSICDNISKESLDSVLIPHVINAMFKEQDELLRISALRVMKNVLIGSDNHSYLESSYDDRTSSLLFNFVRRGKSNTNKNMNKNGTTTDTTITTTTMDKIIECLSQASKDRSYRVRETFAQIAVDIALKLREKTRHHFDEEEEEEEEEGKNNDAINTTTTTTTTTTTKNNNTKEQIEAHLKSLINGFISVCDDENWAVRFNCVKSLHALAKLAQEEKNLRKAGSTTTTATVAFVGIDTDQVLRIFEKLSEDVSKKVQLLTSCELGNIIACSLPESQTEADGEDIAENVSKLIKQYCDTVQKMNTNRGANATDVDIEQIRISCASYFGALCKKLGPLGKWNEISEAFRLLSSPPPPLSPTKTNDTNSALLSSTYAHKARLEIAKSLETIISSLPNDVVVRDICPTVEQVFLNDSNDEVKIVAISQLHHLLTRKCLVMIENFTQTDSNERNKLMTMLSSLAEDSSAAATAFSSAISPYKSRKSTTDSVGSWRVRLAVALSLGNISNALKLVQHKTNNNNNNNYYTMVKKTASISLLPISLKLLKDPVNDVRKAASSMNSFYFTFKNSLPILLSDEKNKDASYAMESIIKLASSKTWTERRTFAECSGRALLAISEEGNEKEEQTKVIQNSDKKLLLLQNTLLTKLCLLMASDAVSSVRLAAIEAFIDLFERDSFLANERMVLSALKSSQNNQVGCNSVVTEAIKRLSDLICALSFSRVDISSAEVK